MTICPDAIDQIHIIADRFASHAGKRPTLCRQRASFRGRQRLLRYGRDLLSRRLVVLAAIVSVRSSVQEECSLRVWQCNILLFSLKEHALWIVTAALAGRFRAC